MQNSPVNWNWQIDLDSEKLVLCLSKNIQFPTFFYRKQLSTLHADTTPFTAEDAELYSAFRDALTLTRLDQQTQFTIAVNATAVCCHLMSCATKSWLFEPLSNNTLPLKLGDIVETQSRDIGYYLVLESDKSTSTLILLSKTQQVDINRVFNQGQVIKVHNDRLEKKTDIEAISL